VPVRRFGGAWTNPRGRKGRRRMITIDRILIATTQTRSAVRWIRTGSVNTRPPPGSAGAVPIAAGVAYVAWRGAKRR